ncbi:MAG: hypothetical protein HQK76_04900 [Desulfobacterales bacterium]|nr:hypothetical protein [Desulfobacterales bacterium]
MKKIFKKTKFIFYMWIGLFLILYSCSLKKDVQDSGLAIMKDLNGSDDSLKKIVGICSFQNNTPYKIQDLKNNIYKVFENSLITVSSDIVPILPDEEHYSDVLSIISFLPSSDRIDNYTLSMKARKAGLNELILFHLIDIRPESRSTGFWFFRKKHSYSVITMRLEILDLETCTKIFDQFFELNTEIDKIKFDALSDKNKNDMQIVSTELKELIKTMGRKAAFEIDKDPWKAYITEIDNEKIKISSGLKSKVHEGQIFNTYSSGDIISGAGGHRFLMPGNFVGKIEITKVYPLYAIGKILSGDKIEIGSAIKKIDR